ncbi:MAG: hypothetical protein IPG98_16315 [Burkholderiales bacterium]|nr:hypothetical protein [Burkholderiales bacterium]
MATETVDRGTPKERDDLYMEIAWELDKVARVLPELVPLEDDQLHFVVRAFAGRMLRLTSVLMDLANYSIESDYSIQQARGIVTLDREVHFRLRDLRGSGLRDPAGPLGRLQRNLPPQTDGRGRGEEDRFFTIGDHASGNAWRLQARRC